MTTDRPDISLIVPFHNAETTIERTLRSIDAQTHKSVERIFVNDGSTDRSYEIVKQYIKNNPSTSGRSILIHTKQQGLANANMTGLNHSTGRYVVRCDADDYMEPDALESMLAVADRDHCDVVISAYYNDTPRGSKIVGFGKKRPASLNDFAINTLHFSLCNKLISLDLLRFNNISPFPYIDPWEDLGVVSRAVALSSRIGIVDRPLYHYITDPSRRSLSRSSRDRLLEDHLRMALLIEQWFLDHAITDKYAECLNHLKFCAKVKMMRGRIKNADRWKRTFPEVNCRILRLRHIPLRYRLLFKAVAILPARFTQWVADLVAKTYSEEDVEK